MPKHADEATSHLIDFYETLSPQTVKTLDRVYAANASFKDPFNDVRGADEIRRVLDRMFESLTDAKFVINDSVLQGAQAFLIWDMTFRLRKLPAKLHKIHGASHIRFDAAGQVARHRDYWDAGEEVYEKIPVLGAVIRMVRKKIG